MTRRTVPGALLALMLALTACGGGEEEISPPAAAELADQISTDLSEAPDIPASDAPAPEDLVVEDVVVGDGAEAVEGTSVEVKYVGGFYGTGEEFDSSWSRGADETLPVVLGAGQVIPGFEQGITGMQEGGRRVIVIPSDLGYGDVARGPIPADSTLVFVIDLVEVGGGEEDLSPPAAAEVAEEVTTDLSTAPGIPASDAPAPTDLLVEDVVVGDGAEAVEGTSVEVKYVGGFYETGEEFDSSWSRGADETLPVVLGAGQVIPGFDQGIVGMQEGGRRVITIPSELGYGDVASGPIPADSTLVFVVDLVEVTG